MGPLGSSLQDPPGENLCPVLRKTDVRSGMRLWVRPTYRETVVLGTKLGCRVSIKSTSSHTTLTRTCCLLSSLDLSAEQWQLSTIRSGQFLLLRPDPHSPTTTHSKLSALILDPDSSFSGFNLNTRSFQVMSSQLLWQVGTISHRLPFQWSPAWAPAAVQISCPAAHLLRSQQLQTFAVTFAIKSGSNVKARGGETLHLAALCLRTVLWAAACGGETSSGGLPKSGSNLTATRSFQEAAWTKEKSCPSWSASSPPPVRAAARRAVIHSHHALLATLDLLRMLVSRKSLPAESWQAPAWAPKLFTSQTEKRGHRQTSDNI